MAETIHVRGEGGSVIPMDLPLPEGVAERLAKGLLRRVNPDGSPYREPAAEPEGPPPQNAPKADWVGYAVRAGGLSAEEAEAMTKADLVEMFGRE